MRVLNVDSQASFDNILVSVIGEISNNSEPSRKFVQTFVLAEQPNGYYVLNDIFRYLVEETEEEATPAVEATEAPEAVAEAPAVPAEEAQVSDEAAVSKVDEKLEDVEANGQVEEPKEAAPQTNGTPEEETPAVAPATEVEIENVEEPLAPEPTPAPEKEEPVPEKETAPTPAVPKTWANIATTSFAAKAAAASKAAAAAAPAAAPKPAAPASQASPVVAAAQPAAAAAPEARSQEPSTDAGWQTAGHDHKKSQPRTGEETVLAYIKNVNDKVDASLLKQVLSRFGKLKYFDVSRPKVCFSLVSLTPIAIANAIGRTVPLSNSTSPLATLLPSPPTPTKLAVSRSSSRNAAPVATPMAAMASLPVVAAVLVAVVVIVPAAKAAVDSSVMAVMASLPVAAVATLLPRAAAPRPRLLKLPPTMIHAFLPAPLAVWLSADDLRI